MIRYYDVYKIEEAMRKYIDSNDICSASLGMMNDWSWTAETIYSDEDYTNNYKPDGRFIMIGGLAGTQIDVPILKIQFSDGIYIDEMVYTSDEELSADENAYVQNMRKKMLEEAMETLRKANEEYERHKVESNIV